MPALHWCFGLDDVPLSACISASQDITHVLVGLSETLQEFKGLCKKFENHCAKVSPTCVLLCICDDTTPNMSTICIKLGESCLTNFEHLELMVDLGSVLFTIKLVFHTKHSPRILIIRTSVI